MHRAHDLVAEIQSRTSQMSYWEYWVGGGKQAAAAELQQSRIELSQEQRKKLYEQIDLEKRVAQMQLPANYSIIRY